ncbi:uncharacterized protein [Haliotis asinina]|uniref:uncharacterized protein n=1 Tax=Haliotis asinina TaxID=109174 RepID=UPI00353235B1
MLGLGTLVLALFLGAETQVLNPGVFDPNCKDHLDNCHEFQWDTCLNKLFKQWVLDNCRQYCKLCIGPTTTTTTTPIPPCIDVESNCHNYPDEVCTNDLYTTWAKTHCRVTCGFCGVVQGVPTPDLG